MRQAYIRPARPEDATLLVPRPEDAAEIALYRPGALLETIESPGWALAAVDEGGLVALFGVAHRPSGAHPWMVAAERVRSYRRQLVLLARPLVSDLRRLPPGTVWNHIGKEAHANRRFVEALGFRIKPLAEGPFDLFELP